MRINERVQNNVVIIEPKGRLTVETERGFTEAVGRLLETGYTHLVLNLGSVRFIDASGLAAIAQAYVSVRRRGGDLKLLHLTRQNHHLLTITKLLTVMDAYDSESEAARSFEGESVRARLPKQVRSLNACADALVSRSRSARAWTFSP